MGACATLKVRVCDFQSSTGLFGKPDVTGSSGELVELTYYNGLDSELKCEPALQASLIPYDLSIDAYLGDASIDTYFRVLESGGTVEKKFFGNEEHTVPLKEALKAFAMGQIENYLQSTAKKNAVLSWEGQEAVLRQRSKTHTYLTNIDAEKLSALVEQTAKSNLGGDLFSAGAKALAVNQAGYSAQCDYLLSSGYLITDTNHFN